jgi:hypothetical protein
MTTLLSIVASGLAFMFKLLAFTLLLLVVYFIFVLFFCTYDTLAERLGEWLWHKVNDR